MATYRTVDGDMLDLICEKHYGQATNIEEQVLAANPHLAELGPIFKAGVIIELPELKQPTMSTNIIRLWD